MLILGKYYQVHPQGFGDLNEKGRGRFKSWPDYLLGILSQKKKFDGLAKRGVLDRTIIDRACRLLQEQASLLEIREPCLVHADIWIRNLLLKNNQITGVLDWENAVGGDSIYDLARYSVSQEEDFNMSDVFKGYGAKTDKKFWQRFHLYRIHCCLYTINRNSEVAIRKLHQQKIQASIEELSKLEID